MIKNENCNELFGIMSNTIQIQNEMIEDLKEHIRVQAMTIEALRGQHPAKIIQMEIVENIKTNSI